MLYLLFAIIGVIDTANIELLVILVPAFCLATNRINI